MADSPLLVARSVRVEFDKLVAVRQVSFELFGGQVLGLIGPNGAGKTTLLRLMAGVLRPRDGRIRLEGVDSRAVPNRRRAQRIAFVPQNAPNEIHQPVRGVVLLGRYPHRPFSLFESPEDRRVADEAMRATAVTQFADRWLSTLSAGEAQRVHIAAALAQRARVLLLDEPTGSLDLRQQLAILDILRRRTREDRVAVVAVMHDVNLAARYCDRVLLLSDGQVAAAGPPQTVITSQVLEPVYGVRMTAVSAEGGGRRWLVPIEPLDGGQA